MSTTTQGQTHQQPQQQTQPQPQQQVQSQQQSSQQPQQQIEKKEEQEEEEEEENIYNEHIMERVIVSVKPVAFYADRARRALRVHEQITVIGFNNFISSACTLVETLKRQKIAHIKKIETTMDTPLLNQNGFVTFARAVPKIVIHLTRGELALFLSGFNQRKITDIFENIDTNSTGRISQDDVTKLNFFEAFQTTNELKQRALKEIHGKTHIALPEFIRFASYCIHPKFREDLFKKTLFKNVMEYQLVLILHKKFVKMIMKMMKKKILILI